VRGYLRERRSLRGVVLLVDGRREEVSELDRVMVTWVVDAGRPLLVVITKIDLVPKNKRLRVARAIERQLGVPAGSALVCSAETGEGRNELYASLFELTRSAASDAPGTDPIA